MAVHTSIINHLEHDYTEPVRDPIWHHIYLSPAFMKIIRLPQFLALGNIKQLGMTSMVYPGATHTRLNHSLGVFHLAKRMIKALSEFDTCTELSVEGLKAFLAAALLHDIGHFPFTHSLKELPLKSHETLTAEIILSKPFADVLRYDVGTDPGTVAAIVDDSMDLKGDSEALFYRRILSGVLDPDKLDYLNRDGYFCGVSYGIQDVDFVINRIMPNTENGISLEAGGLPAVENLLFSKYLMYRTVYWHRTVRIITAMIKKAVFMGLSDGRILPHDLYGLDDNSFFNFFRSSDYEPFSLIGMVTSRDLLKTAIDVPFNPQNPEHERLLDLNNRLDIERRIAAGLNTKIKAGIRPWQVIIDIPEHISFEINIPVYSDGEFLPFPETATVFSRPVVDGFEKTLRRLRLIVPASSVGNIHNSGEPAEWI